MIPLAPRSDSFLGLVALGLVSCVPSGCDLKDLVAPAKVSKKGVKGAVARLVSPRAEMRGPVSVCLHLISLQ